MAFALSGKEVLVTAGSTRAYLDAVRYISNTSSGRLGSIIVAELLRRGARVTFFHGQETLTPRTMAQSHEAPLSEKELSRLRLVRIESVPHLADSMESYLEAGSCAVVVMAMAVLDYVPDGGVEQQGRKMESGRQRWTIDLVPTPKIVDCVKRISPATVLIGFKLVAGLSRDERVAKARALMERSGAEIVIANDLSDVRRDFYRATLVERAGLEGRVTLTEVQGRRETASLLCDRLENRLGR